MRLTKQTFEPWHCWLSLTGLTWNNFIFMGIIRAYGLLHLELLEAFGAGPQRTGLTMFIFSVSSLLWSPLAGLLVDKWSSHTLLMAASLIGLTGLVISAFATSLVMTYIGFGVLFGAPPLPVMVTAMVLVGVLVGGSVALFIQMVTNEVGVKYVGTAMGLVQACFSIGTGIVPIIFGALREATGSYDMVPRLCGAAMLCAALCLQLGRRPICCPKEESLSIQDR